MLTSESSINPNRYGLERTAITRPQLDIEQCASCLIYVAPHRSCIPKWMAAGWPTRKVWTKRSGYRSRACSTASLSVDATKWSPDSGSMAAPWASPSTAITIDEAFDYFQQEESGCLVGFLDGHVKWLDKATIDLPTFRALATCRGGEKVTR